MAAARTCPTCGAALPAQGHQCPECLLRLGLEAVDPPLNHFTPAPDAGLALGFPTRAFGPYELLEEIARGGMGVVFKARQPALDRVVALKLILAGHFAGPEAVRRFRVEAEAAAKLRHPHIVAIHDVGEHEGQHYFTMDYIAGRDLAAVVRDQPVPARRAAAIVHTVAGAVQYAHDHGIVHRDLKPSNILLDQAGQPHVTDFGLAKWFQIAPETSETSDARPHAPDPALTLTGQVLGTPNYIAPEQASGQRGAVSPLIDVYSLGAVLWHLLTGRAPFVGETLTEILDQVLHHEPVSPRLLNPAVPRDLETICLKCLEKEPTRRYVSAQALADELDRFLKDEPIHARPVSRTEKLWRWCRRKPALAISFAAILLLLLTVSIGSPIAAYQINQQRLRADDEARRAQQEKTRAEEQAKIARRESYANMMLLAHESLELSDSGSVQELLEKSLTVFPDAPTSSLITSNAPWEWRYLQYEVRDEAAAVLTGCTNSIHGMAVSPDDQWLAAGTTGGQVLLWHLPTRTLRAEWFTSNTVAQLCFSPDGQRLAFGSRESNVEVWAVPSGKPLARFRERSRILDLRFSADGRLLAFVSSKGLSIGHLLVEPGSAWKPFVSARGVNISRLNDSITEQGPTLVESWRATIANDFLLSAQALVPQGLTFHRAGTNITFPEVVTPQFHGAGAAISPDGLWFALASADRSIEIWSLKEPRRVRCLVGHTADVNALAWSADSRLLASGGDDQVLTVWNVSDGSLRRRLQGHRAGIRVIAFSRDGSTIYSSGSDQTVRIFKSWDTKPPVDRLDFPKVTRHAQLAAGARFGSAKVGDGSVFFQTSPELRLLDVPPAIERSAVGAIAPDGGSVFVECDLTRLDGINRVNRCAIWRQTPSGFVRRGLLEHPFHSIIGYPTYSPDGSRVALLGAGGSLSVWRVEPEPWQELRRWEAVGDSGGVRILFDSTGNRVVAKIDKRGIFSGEIDTGRFIQMPTEGMTLAKIAISADNRFLAIAGDPTTIWQMAPGEEPRRIYTFSKFRLGAASVAFTRDGRRLAIGGLDGQIQIWSFPDLMKVGVLKGHRQKTGTLAFRDDDTLVSVSPDQVRLWRVAP